MTVYIAELYNQYINANVEIYYRHKKLLLVKYNMLTFVSTTLLFFSIREYIDKKFINFCPNIGNLYLHFYEQKFLNRNTPDGRSRYINTYRFID